MAKSPYLEEDCVKHNFKPKDYSNHNESNKSLSFFASIVSLFIYISIFYVFNLSPYTLINNNIFWFFMSNTLILIIAADYGAFSSSNKKKQDLYDEYVKLSQSRNNNNYVGSSPPSSYVITKYDNQQVDDKQCNIISPQNHLGTNNKMLNLSEKKEIDACRDIEIVPERIVEIVKNKKSEAPSKYYTNKKNLSPPMKVSGDGYKKEFEERAVTRTTYRRSKSERYKPKRVMIDEGRNKVRSIRKLEEKVVEQEEEENNEFSKMSNEDLNRRVEEFIQKFNRQIRLQAARNNVVY